MNRRQFIQTAVGTAIATSSFAAFGLSMDNRRPLADHEIQDLQLWAPYDAFLPDETNPIPEDPNDGTTTGILTAATIIAGVPVTMQYWHGHNGIWHMFTITAENFATLKSGNPVMFYVPTTVVEDHYHLTMVDPNRPANS